MDLEALALAVDERVWVAAAERGGGRLYAVRCGSEAGPVLELLARGEARTLPQRVRLPGGLDAIALTSGVWAAPMEDEALSLPPSRHPDRRRAHLTVLVATEGERDGVEVSVLRYGDGAPTVLRGGIGLIHQRMLRCWSRRPEAPWATKRPTSATDLRAG
jgi:hypothetical protein